jgi:flagella basal body P-ring formation protein FlgA
MALRADRRTRVTWGAGVAMLAACGLLAMPVLAQTPTSDVDAAVAAARQAVRDAFGGDAEVTLTRPVLQLTPGAGAVVKAVPEPSSRTAGLVRFVLHGSADSGPTRVGRLTADVRVRARHVRVLGAVASRATLSGEAITAVHEDIGRQPFAPLPTLEDVTGAVARKPLVEGDIVTRSALVARPLVSSGDEVVTVARVGALEVRGRAIAAQSGDLGDTVIVVNPDSRKRLHARVVAGAVVEVLHGS